MSVLEFERDGTRLSYHDYGGSGPPILLLHGLAGYAGEWEQSAQLLVADYRVFALEQRGTAIANDALTTFRVMRSSKTVPKRSVR